MLILQRKPGEQIVIGDDIEITVLEVARKRVKLGISGPAEVAIHRKELRSRILQSAIGGRNGRRTS